MHSDNSFKPKISVVITIYKIEKYLCDCIESVLSSTYKNIELILVDDGSPDCCPSICDDYARKDDRIKVIHQKNQGSIIARRNGVLLSTGEYISIIDGDDWISSDMYERMVEALPNSSIEILFCGFFEETNNNSNIIINSIESGIYEGDRLKEFKLRSLSDGIFFNFGVFPALWCKLIRRDLLIEIQNDVPHFIKMGDDAAITFSIIASSSKVMVSNEIYGYHYRIRQDSLSRSIDNMYFDRGHSLYNYLYNVFKECNEKGLFINLHYYNLFLYKIGVDTILLNKNKGHFFRYLKLIRIGSKTMHIKYSLEFVDRKFFKKNDYLQLKVLSNGCAFCYCVILYAYEFKEYLKSFFKR